MKQKFTLLSLIILLFCSCKKDNETNTANTLAGKHLLFDGLVATSQSLFYSNLDGTGLTQLTFPPTNYFDSEASWSFDGSKIIFVRGLGTDHGLYTIDNKGNNLKNVMKSYLVTFPSFSPDGQRVAYTKSIEHGYANPYSFDVYVINTDGSAEQKITSLVDQNGGVTYCQWSFDGKIYFQASGSSPTAGIYSINPDGSNMQYITNKGTLMAISPDGKYFLYATTIGLSICNSDGSNPKILINLSSPANTTGGWSAPTGGWSADDKEIFYSYYDSVHTLGIYKINVDGSGLTQVLTGYYENPSIH